MTGRKTIKIRFFFQYFFLSNSEPNTNTFTIRIDGEQILEECFIDNRFGHSVFEKTVEIGKGVHTVDAEYKEIKATGTYEGNFVENTGLAIHSAGVFLHCKIKHVQCAGDLFFHDHQPRDPTYRVVPCAAS